MRSRIPALFPSLASLSLVALLSGCAMTDLTAPSDTGSAALVAIKGNVHGGQQPVVGAHVYLFAANSTGYGGNGIAPSNINASLSLLSATSTTHSDSVGAYVLTDSNGSFTITGDYTCSANTQVYLYALGGNPGSGANSAAGFMAGLGNCPSNGSFASSTPFIFVNEVSTVASAYAMAGFASDATHVSSSGTTLALSGIANAFQNEPNIETISTGQALTTTPAGNGTVPQSTINTLANILASCINSTGPSSTPCTTLFANAQSAGSSGTVPTDTATAAINIAHNPGSNVSALFNLSTATPPFSPNLATAPNDFILGIKYNGVGSGTNGADTIAIDANGSVWFTNPNDNSVSKLSSTGAPESPSGGFSTLIAIPTGIAIDLTGNAWIADNASNDIVRLSTNGTPTGVFTGGGVSGPQAVAIDGNGNVWVNNFTGGSISEFNSTGVPQSPATTGYTGAFISHPTGLAIDRFNEEWISDQNGGAGNLGGLSKVANNGQPVTTGGPYSGGGVDYLEGVAIDSNMNVWVTDFMSNALSEFNFVGGVISPSTGYTGGGLSNPQGIAIDGNGNVWVANNGVNTLSEFSTSGTAISPSTGYATGYLINPQAVEIDDAGNIWVANLNTTSSSTANAVTEFVGAAVPRVVPLAVAVKNNTLGTRP